jgi:hypothetical protein
MPDASPPPAGNLRAPWAAAISSRSHGVGATALDRDDRGEIAGAVVSWSGECARGIALAALLERETLWALEAAVRVSRKRISSSRRPP